MNSRPIRQPIPTEGVVAVIRDSQQRFLVIKRADAVTAPGWWCFPGGAIETGETQEAALIRELHEELNIAIAPVCKLWEWSRWDGTLRLHWWRSEWCSGAIKPNPAEIAEVRWLTRDCLLMTSQLLASNREFLDLHVDANPPITNSVPIHAFVSNSSTAAPCPNKSQ